MRLRSATLALACVVFGGPVAAQAIYRCDDGKGGVLCADAPCQDGAKLDVLPGKADPAAIERLKREQRAYDERQAARESKAQAEAQAQRETRRVRAERPVEGEPLVEYGYPVYAWGGYWPWQPVPPIPPRPLRPDASPPSGFLRAIPGRIVLRRRS